MRIAGYKHVYFNITSNTFKIWASTVVCAIAFYETICYLVHLGINRCLRLSMFILFIAVLYPHYYTWWSFFNYINDDFYKQWYHQTFFSLTELMSTFTVLYLADRKRPTTPRLLLVIINIAILHILAAGGDQFVVNVFLRQGEWHQWMRDIGFMLPDIVNIVLPLLEWKRWGRESGVALKESVSRWDLIASVASIAVLWALCQAL